MFENLFAADTTANHRAGPLVDERHRYLLHCASVGAALHTQRNRARALLWIAEALPPRVHGHIDAEQLRQLIAARQPAVASRTAENLFKIARPWLKFIGWWCRPEQPIAFAEALEGFVTWMRDERGLTPCTIEQWRYRTATFLRWCKQTGRDLASLEPEDIDAYFVRWRLPASINDGIIASPRHFSSCLSRASHPDRRATTSRVTCARL